MDSGIIIYPRTLSVENALKSILPKIGNGVIYSNNFNITNEIDNYEIKRYPVITNDVVIIDDIGNIQKHIDARVLYILASWGTNSRQLDKIFKEYPKLKLYRLGNLNDLVQLYICRHETSQLKTCLAQNSHTKQLMCGSLPCNSIIEGFRVNTLESFNEKKKGLYITSMLPDYTNNVEHLHLPNVRSVNNLKEWLNKTYNREYQTLGGRDKMTVHLYGHNLDELIENIKKLDHIYITMWKRANAI